MLSAAWSAVDSWAIENCSNERSPTPAAPSSGAPLFPATAAARPAAIAIIVSILALRTASRERTRCPPVMWPVSCAMTPSSWFAFSARRISPVLKKIACPPADERIELVVLHEIDADIGRFETGDAPDRGGQRADVALDLGVADHARAGLRRRREAAGRGQGRRERDGAQHGERRRASGPASEAAAKRRRAGAAHERVTRCHQPRRGLAGFSVTTSTSSAGRDAGARRGSARRVRPGSGSGSGAGRVRAGRVRHGRVRAGRARHRRALRPAQVAVCRTTPDRR